MVSSLLLDGTKIRALGELLRAGGAEASAPEERIVVSELDWARYLAFDEVLGDDRPGPRLYYLAGSLEIMTTSSEHERLKRWIGSFMDLHFERLEVEVFMHGQATMRDAHGRVRRGTGRIVVPGDGKAGPGHRAGDRTDQWRPEQA